ncbi:MAG: bifunctional adenosylcobinamide kinase/adenosylcobinamide-phosphate guanylyltransferase [Candidatus Omnitrophica bacterium]|nr:bifunctional adenosylcobinamide kinase/adenosylcobinamide-phosphate guanylyltransferase [Candidatus Omnitrophota bacterium]
MGKIIFILGGARSGKSNYATALAGKSGKKVAFIATCQGLDEEMRMRITSHRKQRPSSWKTFEEPLDIRKALKNARSGFDAILIDCLTLLVSNLLLKGVEGAAIEKKITGIIKELKNMKSDSIIVSNEVGLGIVPENNLARDFRDIGGRVNQIVAKEANEVYFLVSGLPVKIK